MLPTGVMYAAAAAGLLSSLLDNPSYTNPASKAMPYLQQMGPKADSAFGPYMNTGTNALQQYYNNASAWATPEGAMNNYNTISAGYEASPWTQYQTDQMQKAAAQSAAASGMAGTPSQQAAVANQVNQINSRAEQEWINSILGTQKEGMSGLSDMSHMGLEASNFDVDAWLKQLMGQSSLAYMGQMNQNAHNKDANFFDKISMGLF